ncbi:MAG: hypothetical protein DRN07_00995 [Thermoplasmata archaeon]|nr:MAG: hypothetical protein DRN07_00995 [Thermoplasmata archaeon]
MRLKLRFPEKKKSFVPWLILLCLIVIGVLAYLYREPLSKALVFRKAEIQEFPAPTQPTSVIPELQETPLQVEEGKIVGEQKVTVVPAEPKESSEEKVYVEVAERGEGITHLARKALAEYLKEKGENIALTKAHKIYIEDYMQKRTGWRWLKLGEKVSFSEKLIEEAIEKSLKLTEEQLQNILNFTPPPTFVE